MKKIAGLMDTFHKSDDKLCAIYRIYNKSK